MRDLLAELHTASADIRHLAASGSPVGGRLMFDVGRVAAAVTSGPPAPPGSAAVAAALTAVADARMHVWQFRDALPGSASRLDAVLSRIEDVLLVMQAHAEAREADAVEQEAAASANAARRLNDLLYQAPAPRRPLLPALTFRPAEL